MWKNAWANMFRKIVGLKYFEKQLEESISKISCTKIFRRNNMIEIFKALFKSTKDYLTEQWALVTPQRKKKMWAVLYLQVAFLFVAFPLFAAMLTQGDFSYYAYLKSGMIFEAFALSAAAFVYTVIWAMTELKK